MNVKEKFEEAKKVYEEWDIDVESALKALSKVKISIQCWQGDDINGFEVEKNELSGGIQATGNYLGKARDAEELRADLEMALKLIPGKHKINLHSIYAETDNQMITRDQLKPLHFAKWVQWAKEQGLGLDFNPTLFSHPLAESGLTLSHPKQKIRDFWIRHVLACREIGEYFGQELGQTCYLNLWIPDGYKDIPSDRLGPRLRLKNSLDEIYKKKHNSNYLRDTLESKVFGIGVEAFTVGSSEFYLNYASRNGLLSLMDTGHYHPTEMVSDKISAMLPFFDQLVLHVSRPVRWDSDHVILFDDELKELAKEIVRNEALNQVIIGLDFFDASINRVAAWTIGTRNMIKALLFALLQPNEKLKALQDEENYTERLAIMEEFKTYPFGDIWNYYCEIHNVPIKEKWLTDIKDYEKAVLMKRGENHD